MGKVDTVTKAYMRKNNFFADAFNYLIYDGKPVVNPEQLRELGKMRRARRMTWFRSIVTS